VNDVKGRLRGVKGRLGGLEGEGGARGGRKKVDRLRDDGRLEVLLRRHSGVT
jgi:hypothetical protein